MDTESGGGIIILTKNVCIDLCITAVIVAVSKVSIQTFLYVINCFYATIALALMESITFFIPIHTVISVKISTILP